MKKCVGFMIAIISFLIIGFENVWADEAEDLYRNVVLSVKGNAATMVCQYYDEARKDEYGVVMFYRFDTNQSRGAKDRWEIYYKLGGKWKFSTYFAGSFSTIFETNERIHFQDIGGHYTGGETNFTCPQYAFIDESFNHELCFSDGVTCGEKTFSTNFTKHGPYALKNTGETIFD